MIKIDSCIVCKSTSLEPLYAGTFSGDWEAAVPYFLTNRKKAVNGPVARCRDCGIAFTHEQFTAEQYERIYNAIPAAVDAGKSRADTIRFKKLIGLVQRYCPAGRFVDFGGADGGFVALAKLSGYDASMFDLRPGAGANPSAWNSDHPVERGQDQELDFITAWDVLEHLPDIDRKMKLFRDRIRAGGYLFFTIPDMGSRMSRIFRSKWNCVLLEHLWYFDRPTIKTYGENFGFELIDVGSFSFSVDLGTLVKRLAQTFATPEISLPDFIGNRVVTLPTGLMAGVFRKLPV